MLHARMIVQMSYHRSLKDDIYEGLGGLEAKDLRHAAYVLEAIIKPA